MRSLALAVSACALLAADTARAADGAPSTPAPRAQGLTDAAPAKQAPSPDGAPLRDPPGDPLGDPPTDPVSPGHRTLAFGAALVPGVLLHGSGHFALGRRQTAYRLLAIEGVGLALMVTAALPLWFTSASRYIAQSAGMVGAMGAGLFATSLQADLYGTLMPLDWRGKPARTAAIVEAELGYRYVSTEQFEYASFVVAALDLRWQGVRVSPSGWYALDDQNARHRLAFGYRFLGPRPGLPPAADGTFLEMEGAVTHHRFGTERFDSLTGEVMTLGRLDLERVDAYLTGTFSELGVGIGLGAFDQRDDDAGLEADREAGLMLVHLGFGFYLGGPSAPRAEVLSYYEHRHDDFAGGLVENAIGVPGHMGVSSRIHLSEQLGLAAMFEIGADLVTGISLLIRQQDSPSPTLHPPGGRSQSER